MYLMVKGEEPNKICSTNACSVMVKYAAMGVAMISDLQAELEDNINLNPTCRQPLLWQP